MLSIAAIGIIFAEVVWAQELTEAQLIERFLARSPQLRVLGAGVAVTRAEVQARVQAPNPIVTYSREGAGFTEFLQIEQPLILTKRRAYLREAGASAVAAAELDSQRALWDLRCDLRQAFYGVLTAQQRKQILEASKVELEEVIRVLRQREAEGEGSKYDRLRAEREMLDLRTELSAVSVSLEQARNRVAAFLPDDPELRVMEAAGAFGSPRAATALEVLLPRALENRPDYSAAKIQAERYQKEKLAAERLRIPDPLLIAGLKRGETAPRTANGYVLALSVPIPLFNRGRAEVSRAQAEYERSLGRIELLRNRILTDVQASHRTFETRRIHSEAYQRELEQEGKELTRIAQFAYHEGERSILELLDVYRSARHGRLKALELQATTKEAEIELARAVGEEVFP